MRNYLWAVEEQWGDGNWLTWDDVRPTRQQARDLQKSMAVEPGQTRIRKYVRVEGSK